jgi:polysaccharide export outer membrane protein
MRLLAYRRSVIWSCAALLVLLGLTGLDVSAGAAAEYALGPEDTLHIAVWKDDSLSREVIIRPDGMISFPLVGDVQAEGRTVEELKKELTTRLTAYVQDPVVSVIVTKVSSYKIYVIGRVNRPGEFMLGHQTDVMQALSLAGGLTPYASENQIKILRRDQHKTLVYPFRYDDVQKGKDLEQNILLKRDDVVVVP